MAKKKSEKKSLDDVLGKFDGLSKFSKIGAGGYDVISTGSPGLDRSSGIGGIPRGRIVEIYGPESSGKTTVVLSTIAEAQKQGLRCAFIDAEHAFDPTYAEAIGVNLDELLYIAHGAWGPAWSATPG